MHDDVAAAEDGDSQTDIQQDIFQGKVSPSVRTPLARLSARALRRSAYLIYAALLERSGSALAPYCWPVDDKYCCPRSYP